VSLSGADQASPFCPFCTTVSVLYWRSASVYRCSRCGLLFRYPQPSERELAATYAAKAVRPEVGAGGTRLGLAREYTRWLARSLGRSDLRGLKILDFGTGAGNMMVALTEMGAEAYGVEPFGGELLKKKGLRIFSDVGELSPGLRFDGIMMIDVIEHMPAPWRVLSGWHERLVPGGWVLITTPNARGLNARLMGDRWREARAAEHLFFFTPGNLETIVRESNFQHVCRLRWLVEYGSGNPLRNFLALLLQRLAVDGALRYLLRRSQ